MIRRLLEGLRGAGVTEFQQAAEGGELARQEIPLVAVTPYRVFAQHMTPTQVELMQAPQQKLK